MKKHMRQLISLLLALALVAGLAPLAFAETSSGEKREVYAVEPVLPEETQSDPEGDHAVEPVLPEEPASGDEALASDDHQDAEPSEEPEKADEAEMCVVSDGPLNVRSGPATSYSLLGSLSQGTIMTVGEKLNGWYQITCGDLTGYVCSDYVSMIEIPEFAGGEYTSGLYVNEVAVPYTGYLNVGGTSYITVQAFASIMVPAAAVSESNGTVTVSGSGLTLSAGAGATYIEANGRCLYVSGGTIYVNGRVAVPVQVMAKVCNMDVYTDASVGVTFLMKREGAADFLTSGSAYYNSDSLYWLSHIINAESGNQPLNGKIAVGNVIMNRVNDTSTNWPDTIQGVIFQTNQFSPAMSGSVYKDPNAQSIVAAKLVLEGVQVLPTAKFFNATYLKNTWAARNRPYLCTIGGHAFYA